MRTERTDVPLLQALDEFIRNEYAYFAIPGHRYDRGMPEALSARLGREMYRYDLTESIGLDDLHNAKGVIKEAQEAAAALFGADACRFSVNGTTALIEAMILACAGPGEEIIIARDVHRSAVSGLILSGAKPVWLLPEYDEKWEIFGGICPDSVEKILNEHPEAKAVLIVHPTYYGQASDAAAIADICHAHQVPLLVDSAHGTHLSFSRAFPQDSISAGADLTAMSLHKTAGSMTQTSMLFYRNPAAGMPFETKEKKSTVSLGKAFADLSKVDEALRMTISSSPSYVLMASLDAARWQLQRSGEEDAQEAVNNALALRRALQEIPGVLVRGGSDLFEILRDNLDVTRVVFRVPGIRGTDLRDILAEEGRIVVEMADAENVVAVVTSANTKREIFRFSGAVFKAAASAEKKADAHAFACPDLMRDAALPLAWRFKTESPVQTAGSADPAEADILPRDAFFAEKEVIPLSEAEGRICAEIICPYPPGIAALVPGERITAQKIEAIEHFAAANIPVQGLSEKKQIRVICEP